MEITDNQANPFDVPGLVQRAVAETKKPALRLACLVDYTGKISNFFEDLLRLEGFAQSVEDELNRTVPADRESQEDS